MISKIYATKNGEKLTWSRSTIGDLIEKIPDHIRREGGFINIMYKYAKKTDKKAN